MNIIALCAIQTGFGTYKEGEMLTVPNVDGLRLIKNGAAKPANRRARSLVEDADAIEKQAQALIDALPMDPGIAAARRNENSGAGPSFLRRSTNGQTGRFTN